MQAGMKLAVGLRAVRPDGSTYKGTAVAAFFGPGKDPVRVPADREPDRMAVLAFDPVSRTYGAEVSTAGWEPGRWMLRGAVSGDSGAPEGWDWFSFTLEP